jgi:predicted enzyme related to lactoylglutathione lyase
MLCRARRADAITTTVESCRALAPGAGDGADAKEFYEKVFSLDINFKDVTERLRALR